MISSVLTKKIQIVNPKLYSELFDTNSVFLALTQVLGKKILKFLVEAKISVHVGHPISGRLYGLPSSSFFPFSGIVRSRKELTARFFPQLCELELDTDENMPSGLPRRNDIR